MYPCVVNLISDTPGDDESNGALVHIYESVQ
jgi:hypothetical protein